MISAREHSGHSRVTTWPDFSRVVGLEFAKSVWFFVVKWGKSAINCLMPVRLFSFYVGIVVVDDRRFGCW
jgi:hypothetical protein